MYPASSAYVGARAVDAPAKCSNALQVCNKQLATYSSGPDLRFLLIPLRVMLLTAHCQSCKVRATLQLSAQAMQV